MHVGGMTDIGVSIAVKGVDRIKVSLANRSVFESGVEMSLTLVRN